MPSAEAITRSSGAVMKPRTRSALAPTYTVVTVMAAFSLRGYCRTLSERIACTPAITIKRLTTMARTGRRMNRSVNLIGTPRARSLVHWLGAKLGARGAVASHVHLRVDGAHHAVPALLREDVGPQPRAHARPQVGQRLLREPEVGEDGVDGLEGGDGRPGRQDLAQLDLPDGDAAVEGRADGLLGDGRLQGPDVGDGLLGARLRGVEVRGRAVVRCPQRPIALQGRPGH